MFEGFSGKIFLLTKANNNVLQFETKSLPLSKRFVNVHFAFKLKYLWLGYWKTFFLSITIKFKLKMTVYLR